MEQKFNVPTETVDLPSKGLLYPKDSPLSSGQIEMKYMTAKEEDIITNTNYIKNGTVIDKLLQSLIVSPVNYGDLLVGDKNAIMVAARILSYGSTYEFEYDKVPQSVELSSIEHKELHPDFEKATSNEFSYTLPHTKIPITFKILTHNDEQLIDREIKGLQKINKESKSEVTVRMSHIITSVNGSREQKDIREFVNKAFLAMDIRAFRKHYLEISPDLNMKVTIQTEEGEEQEVDLPIGISFFWPDAGA